MATLEVLWRSLFPAARPVMPLDPARAGREVGWVRLLKARVPAFDVLEAGDLAIVPAGALAAVAPGAPETAALAGELRAVGVAALVIVEGPGDEVDAGGGIGNGGERATGGSGTVAANALADAAAAAGLPAFVLGGGDAVGLERSVIGYLVNAQAELERQAARLEATVEEVALRGGDLEAIVGAISAFFGRAAALEARRGDLVAVHAPAGVAAAAGAVSGYLAGRRGAALRVPLPGTAPPDRPADAAADADVEPAGALVLLGGAPVSELERLASERIAGLLALELARDAAIRSARDGHAEPLPADGPPWVMLVARQAAAGDPRPIEEREEVRRELRLLGPARRLVLRGSAESLELRIIAALDPADPIGLGVGGRIAAFLGRTVVVSHPFDEPADRPTAEAEARATLEAIESIGEAPPVVRAGRLPAWRLLASLRLLPDGPRQARALLEPLLVGSPAVQRERLRTLRAVLEHPGLAEAAAALDVHRNTIAYRVRRIEALTGWELSDPDLRLPLALAVRIVQSDQG